MKKLYTALLVLVMFCLTAGFYAAAEDRPNDKIHHAATAIYRYSSDPNVYTALHQNASYSITTNDGVTITVTGLNGTAQDMWMLVVRQIKSDDKEAWRWFEQCTKDIGTNILPYEIYFVDKSGNREPLDGRITVAIALPDAYRDPVVCSLSTSGQASLLTSALQDREVRFRGDSEYYYIILEKNTGGGSPPTGDGNPLSQIFLFVASFGTIILLRSGKVQRGKRAQ